MYECGIGQSLRDGSAVFIVYVFYVQVVAESRQMGIHFSDYRRNFLRHFIFDWT